MKQLFQDVQHLIIHFMVHRVFALVFMFGPIPAALAHDGPHDGGGVPLWQLIVIGIVVAAGTGGIAWIRRRSSRIRDELDDGNGGMSE